MRNRRDATATNEYTGSGTTLAEHPMPSRQAIPSGFQSSLPPCARACLVGYIEATFDCLWDSRACLCLQYSMRGYALGELAYICLQEQCRETDLQQSIAAYNICTAVPHAVSPTHQTLTLPSTFQHTRTSPTPIPTTTPLTGRPATTKSNDHTKSATSGPSLTHQPLSTHAATTTSAPQAHRTASAAFQSGAIMAQLSPKQQSSTSLTSAQAAGVTVAAFGVIILAVVAIYLIFYCRRRRLKCKEEPSNERKSYDFIDEAPPRFSPFNYGYADPRGPLGGGEKRRAELDDERRVTHFPGAPMSSYEGYIKQPEKAATYPPPGSAAGDARQKPTERATPAAKLLPVPPKAVQKSPAPSALTATTFFEEDRPPVPPMPFRKPLPQGPRPGPTVSQQLLSVPPSQSRVDSLQILGHMPMPTPKVRTPASVVDFPQRTPNGAKPISATVDDFPLPPVPNPELLSVPSLPHNSSHESNASVLEYYSSPDAGSGPDPDIIPAKPARHEGERSLPTRSHTAPSTTAYPLREGRINSQASDTSFESVGTDDPTPSENGDKQLTPVAESPISGIKYPKVPRSSNQAVARSPKIPSSAKATAKARILKQNIPPRPPDSRARQQQPPVTPERQPSAPTSLSGTTLAAKRRGDDAAQDLERRFYIHDPASGRTGLPRRPDDTFLAAGKYTPPVDRHDSPLKGYGRVTSGGRVRPPLTVNTGQGLDGINGLPSRTQMKRPEYGRNLTPHRRGDDLYLSAGLTTPQDSHFPR